MKKGKLFGWNTNVQRWYMNVIKEIFYNSQGGFEVKLSRKNDQDNTGLSTLLMGLERNNQWIESGCLNVEIKNVSIDIPDKK